MPDLDKLLDTLVADVAAGTRAPGASAAVKHARRRRAIVATVAVAVVAIVAVGGAVVAGDLGGRGQPSPIGVPTAPSSESPAQQSGTPPASLDALSAQLDALLEHVPGWAISSIHGQAFPDGYDYAFNGPCAGRWGDRARGGSDGGIGGPATRAGIGHHRFASSAQASHAVAAFVHNLASCTRTAWRTQPIDRPGAVLASSPDAVTWIQQTGADVWVLQVPTNDGPPPVGVQVQVAEWMVSYRTWQEHNRLAPR